jgi:uncharacterized membrane protein (DUF4010 family)
VKWPELPPNLPLVEFAIALLIGALVGIDRERKKSSEHLDAIGGLRTFILLAEAGAISAWLAKELDSAWIFAVAGAVAGALVIAGYVAVTRTHDEGLGATTEVAAIVVFLLGGLVVFGYRDLAVILAVTTSALLAYKQPLHGLVARLSQEDIFAVLKLLIATFIVLPILPNQPLDPWGAINPYRMWWLVILISGLSLAGYVATRWLGSHHGTVLTGLFGGLASSTAVTFALSKQSVDEDSGVTSANALAAGLLMAWTVMFARIVVEVAVVNAPLLWAVIVPIAAMGLASAGATAVLYLAGRSSAPGAVHDVPLKNPFSLTSALKFALLFTIVQLAVKLVQTYLPPQSFYAVAALAGLTDVDAITLSMAEYARDADWRIATTSIVVAAITNTLVKCGLVILLGARTLAVRISAATGALLIAGAAALACPSLKPPPTRPGPEQPAANDPSAVQPAVSGVSSASPTPAAAATGLVFATLRDALRR